RRHTRLVSDWSSDVCSSDLVTRKKVNTASSDPLKTVIVEAVLTFFLVTAVFGTAVRGRNGNAAGFAIGFVLVMDILMGGALTGRSEQRRVGEEGRSRGVARR